MAFDVSALSEFVELHSKEISSKAVLAAETADLLVSTGNVQTGVKGKAPVLKMDADVTFQDGSSCGRTASGDVTLNEATINVVPIKDLQNICTKSLYNTHYAWALKEGQDPEQEGWDAGFAQYVMDLRSAKIKAQVEKLLWQGDTDSGTGNMKLADGIDTVATNSTNTSTTAVDVSGGSDMVEKLQILYKGCDVDVRSQDDFRIFVGRDTYDSYKLDLAAKNIYQPQDDFTLFGTGAKLQVVNGLNGTDDAIATRISNLQLGLDGSDETDFASLRYSTETENWYMDFHFAIGVAIVFIDEVKVGDLAKEAA